MVVSRCESLTSQRLLTIGAIEAFAVKGHVLVGDPTLRDHLDTLCAFGGKVVFVAGHAKDFVVLGYEALAADGRVACAA